MASSGREMTKELRMRWLLEFGNEPVYLLAVVDTWVGEKFSWRHAIDDGYLEETGDPTTVRLSAKGRNFKDDNDENK